LSVMLASMSRVIKRTIVRILLTSP
jgi:hypothetical protein